MSDAGKPEDVPAAEPDQEIAASEEVGSAHKRRA